MAKLKKSGNGKLLFDPKKLTSDVPVPKQFGMSVQIKNPNEYKFIKEMEQGQSYPFKTDSEEHNLINRIRAAIKKEDPTIGLIIKQVDNNTSRIWRDDTQAKKKKWGGNRHTGSLLKKKKNKG